MHPDTGRVRERLAVILKFSARQPAVAGITHLHRQRKIKDVPASVIGAVLIFGYCFTYQRDAAVIVVTHLRHLVVDSAVAELGSGFLSALIYLFHPVGPRRSISTLFPKRIAALQDCSCDDVALVVIDESIVILARRIERKLFGLRAVRLRDNRHGRRGIRSD